MAPLDEQFRHRVSATFETWVDGFAKVLARGQREGTVRTDVDARRFATFLVAAIEGSFGLAKSSGSKAVLRSNLDLLTFLLETLRPVRTIGTERPRRKPARKRKRE
jgi:hypothetical protein